MSDWERRFRVGRGEARARRDVGTERVYEYEEDGHVLRERWDPRETGTVFPVDFRAWSEPPGAPMSNEARERAFLALWRIARKDSVRALLEFVGEFHIARHWARTSGFLLSVYDGGRIEYMERGRTLELSFHHDHKDYYRAIAEPPAEPRWTYPPETAVAPEHWERIQGRLRSARSEDMWIGANLGWRIEIRAQEAIS
jgi:hypothetical protein